MEGSLDALTVVRVSAPDALTVVRVSTPGASTEPPGEIPAVAALGPIAGAEPSSAGSLPPLPPLSTPPPPPPKAAQGSPVAEIASFASSLQESATRRAGLAVGYEHVAGLSALAAGLALLALVLSEATWLRVFIGVLATLLLAVTLASAALFVLARRGSSPRSSSFAPGSEQVPSPASQAGASLTSLTRRARIVLAASAVAVCAVSVTATALVAAATGTPERPPRRAVINPISASSAAPPEQEPEVPPEKRADSKLRREGHVSVSGGVLYVPPSFRSDDGAFDLLVHFHGNTQLVEESVGAAKVNALVYVVNLGTGSGVYEERYAQSAIFDDALTRVRDAAEKRGLAGAKMRRLALSSWSAGYGAIAKILEAKKNVDRIDALLMMDGLHVAYMDPKTKAALDKVRLGPFIRFAKEAAQGQKLFSITHGDTETHGYATTGEAADVLLREVGAERSPASGSPPKVTLAASLGVVAKNAERWLEQTSEAHAGGMWVRGYVGKTPEHHMAHLIQMSVTVLPDLVERWQ